MVTEPLRPDDSISNKMAYVYGRFSLKSQTDALSALNFQSPGGIALELDTQGSKDGKPKYIIQLTQEDNVFAIAVQPGIYNWGNLIFTRGMKIHSNKIMTKDNRLRQLELKENKVYYIGDYQGLAKIKFSPGRFNYRWQLQHIEDNFQLTTQELKKRYVKLTTLEMLNATVELFRIKYNSKMAKKR